MAELKRPENIPGYQHPTSSSYSRQSMYKTFTEGNKPKKKEKFGKTTGGKQYASYGELEEELCPLCEKPPIKTCPCSYNDKYCDEGHIWYTNRDGNIKQGNPHQ
jgi:hypothetical protein